MPPNIILIILAFYFLNGNKNNKYHDKNKCINVSQENNFNLLVILILIIIYYSNSIPEDNLTYISAAESENAANGNIKRTPNEGINKESNGTNDDTKKADAAKSIQNTVSQSKNTQNTASQSKSNNSGNSNRAISKHIGKQEEFTYANKEVKSDTQDCSISKYINNDYQGATVTVLLSNGTTVTGDVIFTFEDIVSLKTKDNIIFISSRDIVSFY